MRIAQSLLRWHRGVTIPFTLMALLLGAIIALGHAPPPLSGPTPYIPPYPNTIGAATYPGGWELRLLGEGFGGFATQDSSEVVQRYYTEQLPLHGWRNGWYQNILGYCYTLLIIPSTAASLDATHINLKLRQAFSSELGRRAPAGCK